MLLTAACIRLESSGPILYRQTRVGESGKAFELIKFRSMRVDAEKDGVACWAKKNDDRTTRVGSFIRMAVSYTHLDVYKRQLLGGSPGERVEKVRQLTERQKKLER